MNLSPHAKPVVSQHWKDDDGNPAGGTTHGLGFSMRWQEGPIDDENPRNGAFLEEVIEGCLGRLRFLNDGKFACRENSLAITALEDAQNQLNRRTWNRMQRGVEGTHEV